MSYNKDNFARVGADFRDRQMRDRADADRRTAEAEMKIPDLREIRLALAESGLKIMKATLAGDTSALDAIRSENESLRRRRAELLTAAGYPPDYTEIHYECPDCFDTGYSDGRMCHCMKEALTLAGIESSGLGELVRTQSFDSFSLDYYEGQGRVMAEKNLAMLRAFAENFSGRGDESFLLMGGTGLGKTHLSSSVAMNVLRRGFDVAYITAGSLFAVFERQRFGDGHIGDGTDDRFYDAELLIIDDLGTENSNQFTRSCLYNVINSRVISGRSTMINTNLTHAKIRETYEDRITSRLFGEYRTLIFSGNDIRRQKLERR